MNPFTIRLLHEHDAAGTLEVYRPYVEDTAISFEYETPSLEEWKNRISHITAEYPWLVCEHNGQVIGYAYASKHRTRTAYSWAVESTVYLSDKFHRLGIARILYEALFEVLRLQGYVNVYAGITMPNIKSEEFHKALGFYELGLFKKIGYKFGAWHDTKWLQLHLVDHPVKPSALKLPAEIKDTPAFQEIMRSANAKLVPATQKFQGA
jgi:L-amino acid N-acyltransferase YncA